MPGKLRRFKNQKPFFTFHIPGERIALLFCITLFACCAKKEPASADLFSVQLTTVDHRNFSFQQLSDNQASVILFIQPECPLCNSYGKTMHALDSTYSSQKIPIYGVVAGKNYSDSEIKEFLQKHRLSFTTILDPEFRLKNLLHARVTPQVFLIDNKGSILYHGLIDDWAVEIGQVRAHVSYHFLADAIDAYLQNRPIANDSTKAVGCYIE
ncbi:MAG: redoxin domain-containing protein [Chitinophagales bacterium]|nr:redoxin domain-containing protein [Chitinophagales bacterium]